ncbi:MAG: hypothetical protein V4635_02020 [Bacteroidota bacterium]
MTNKKIDRFFTATSVLIALGLIFIIAGIYFIKNDLTSSGVTMGRLGAPYGKGTIDGNGMIFCGIVVAGFGLTLRNTKNDTTDE